MMTHAQKILLTRCRLATFALALAVLLVAFYAMLVAQTPAPAKKAMTIDDYTKWRSLSGQEMSSDGKWLVYTLQGTNVPAAEAKPVLHLQNLETNAEVTVADATGGTFSLDSKWIAYQVDPGAAQRARAGRGSSGGSGGGGSGGAESATQPPTQPSTPP